MSNVGLFHGLTSVGWRDYQPRIHALGGSPTQMIVSDERNLRGRWLLTNQGKVKVSVFITLAAGDTLPSGETFSWAITLPFPANRSSGGADLPIGTALLWQGAAANPSPVLVGQVTLCDPQGPWASSGEEDKHCQVFLSEILGFGTAAFTSGSLTTTVTHGLPGTPNAYDIHVTLTNTPSTNPQWWSVQNIGATTFDIVLKASSTTTPATFSWKVEAFPNSTLFQLMGSGRPWTWAAGHVIGLQLEYEARR